MIVPDKKIIYIHIPKCGGGSLTKSIAKALGTTRDKLYKNHSRMRVSGAYNHPHAKHFQGRKFEEYWKFSNVRNPYSRLVSYYFYLQQIKKNKLPLFDKWVLRNIESLSRSYLMKSQCQILGINKNYQVDWWFKLEDIENKWFEICERTKLDLGYMHVKRTEHKDWHVYYTPKTKKMVERLYREDLDFFGYSFKDN